MRRLTLPNGFSERNNMERNKISLRTKILIAASLLVGMGVGSVGLGTAHAQAPVSPPAHNESASQSTVSDQPGTSEMQRTAGAETDGPGGHQDPDGVDVQAGGGA